MPGPVTDPGGQQAGAAGASTSSAPASIPQMIWNALLAMGVTPPDAAGIMGNFVAESRLNPESSGMDTNGYVSYGLASWNSAPGNYPTAASLVTGNPETDINNQLTLLQQSGGLNATGQASDAATAAANFAHNYERCAACGYDGGSGELNIRAGYANTIYQIATAGDWANLPSSLVSSTPANAALTSSTTGTSSTSSSSTSSTPCCAINSPSLPLVGGSCLVTHSELKAIKAGLIFVAGAVSFLAGASIMVAFGLKASGAQKAIAATPIARVPRAALKARAATKAQKSSSQRSAAREQARRQAAGERELRSTARARERTRQAAARRSEGEARQERQAARSHGRRLQMQAARSEQRRAETRERGRQSRKTTRARESARTEGHVTRREYDASTSSYRQVRRYRPAEGQETPFN